MMRHIHTKLVRYLKSQLPILPFVHTDPESCCMSNNMAPTTDRGKQKDILWMDPVANNNPQVYWIHLTVTTFIIS